MDIEALSRELEAAHQRMNQLHRRADSRLRPTKALLAETLEELHISLEQMRVSEEELRQQNEELFHISERLAAEQARYQDLFDFAPEGYLVTDLHGKILEANRAALHQLDRPLKFLKEKILVRFVLQQDRAGFRQLLNSLQASREETPALEWNGRIMPRGLPPFEAALLAAPVRDRQSGQMRLRWTIRDITRSRQAERLLAAQTVAMTQSLNALVSELALPDFLEETLSVLERQFRSESLELWLREPDEETPTLARRRPALPLPDGSSSLSAHPAWWQALLQTRQAFMTAPDSAVPGREQTVLAIEERLLIVPLIVREHVIGGMSMRCVERAAFQSGEIAFVQALAQQMALAIHLTRLMEQSRENAILQERNRMAREIHDVLAQSFVGIVLQMEGAMDALTHAPEQICRHLELARKLASEGLADARKSVIDLRPQLLEQGSLVSALEQLQESMQPELGPVIQLEIAGQPRPLAPEVENNLFRIGQEALTNALRHAQAKLITLRLAYKAGQVSLSIRDDGSGFTPDTPPSGFGLQGIRERAARLQAQCSVTSQPKKGTEVRVVVSVP